MNISYPSFSKDFPLIGMIKDLSSFLSPMMLKNFKLNHKIGIITMIFKLQFLLS